MAEVQHPSALKKIRKDHRMYHKKINKYAIPLVLALATAAAPALAQDAAEEEPGSWLPGEFSGGVALTSNYVFRGISQTNNEPAIQGNIDYSIDTGLAGISVYGGFWASNVDFQDDDEAQVEIDWSFGLTGEIADTGLGWTLGGIYYSYPGSRGNLNYDYWEIYPALSYSPIEGLALDVAMNYSPDYFAASGDSYYPNGTVSYEIPGIPKKWFTLTPSATLGYIFIDDNDAFGTPSYLTWALGATVNIKGLDVAFTYTDTNLSKNDCFGGTQNWCEAKFIGTVSYSF
ncbi:MAG: hypothetical protein HC834_00535 [Rhodospirillales bacterium]|nr:hypothetical protein [Rhodospirillales bacterium]